MQRALGILREGEWLTAERAIAYSRIALAAYLIAILADIAGSHAWIDAQNVQIGQDFYSFRASGVLAVHGEASATYVLNPQARELLLRDMPIETWRYQWPYPPVALLITAIFGLLPYVASLLLWTLSTAVGYVACIRKILPHPWTVTVALAWPAFFVNLTHGQNGAFSAALVGGGLLLLDTRPLLAGVLFGGLAYKPHLALLIPVALIAAHRWRTLIATAATALVLGGVTVVLFGLDVWRSYVTAGLEVTTRVLNATPDAHYGATSVFSAIRLLGAGVAVSAASQAVVSAAVAGCIAWAWAGRRPLHLQAALLAAAIPLATPHAFPYDLPISALAVAWLVRDGIAVGFLPWERLVIAACCLVPAVSPLLASTASLQIGPLVQVALVAVLVRRLLGARQ